MPKNNPLPHQVAGRVMVALVGLPGMSPDLLLHVVTAASHATIHQPSEADTVARLQEIAAHARA